MTDCDSYTLVELKKLASIHKLKNYSKLNKAELCAYLIEENIPLPGKAEKKKRGRKPGAVKKTKKEEVSEGEEEEVSEGEVEEVKKPTSPRVPLKGTRAPVKPTTPTTKPSLLKKTVVEQKKVSFSQPVGMKPPSADKDSRTKIPDQLLPYWYLYSESGDKITRFFILPEDYTIAATQLIEEKGVEPYYMDIDVKMSDFLDGNITFSIPELSVPFVADSFSTSRGDETNLVAPTFCSEDWISLIDRYTPVQLRYQYQIIQNISN